ncbi:uncharacterized protein METZ01_LOCUS231163, partial [marine metagenome]
LFAFIEGASQKSKNKNFREYFPLHMRSNRHHLHTNI